MEISSNLNNLINSIAWWVPFKKKRNDLRNNLLNCIDSEFKNIENTYDILLYNFIDNFFKKNNIKLDNQFINELLILTKKDIFFYKYDKDNNFIYLTKDNINLVTDFYNQVIVKEVFYDNLYDIDKYLDVNKQYVFFDIGCNKGYTTLYYSQKKYCKSIYSFELVPNIFRYAKKNIDINPVLKDKVHLYNFGLSNCNKTIKVAYYPFHDYLSSINKNFTDTISKLEKMEYVENYVKDTAYVLKEIIKENKIYNELVIKIDTEGSEYDIFDSLLNNYIDIFDKVKLFIGEFHFGTNGIDKKLEDLGFISYITGRDFIFYRPDQTRPDQTRPDQTRIICSGYIYIYNNLKFQKLQPTLQYKFAA